MKLAELMPLEKAFHVRSQSVYDNMRRRFAERKNIRGRIIQHAREVPFTLEDFRAWLIVELNGTPGGCGFCAYCRCPLTAESLRVDHKVPPQRGGGLGLENLAITCDSCNQAKGKLTPQEFDCLKQGLDDFLRRGILHPDGYKDIWSRLKGRLAIYKRKRQESKVAEDDADF